jgi:hypothetical protein
VRRWHQPLQTGVLQTRFNVRRVTSVKSETLANFFCFAYAARPLCWRRSASTQVPSWSLLGVRKFDCRISENPSTRRGRLDHFEHQVVRISEHNQFESPNVDRLGAHRRDLAARRLPGFCHGVDVLHTKLKNRCARILEALEPNHVPVELDRPVEAGARALLGGMKPPAPFLSADERGASGL